MDYIDRTTPDLTLSKAKWDQIDVIILLWIYETITHDILLTIPKPSSTAREAWLDLKNLFHDNKNARAADLDKFSIMLN